MALVEWGLTPEYINNHWTEEKFQLLLDARLKRYAALLKPQQRSEGKMLLTDLLTMMKSRGHKIQTRIT